MSNPNIPRTLTPIYNYIKGQGWVPNGAPYFLATTFTKRKVRVEVREPRPRERYRPIYPYQEDLLTNGEVDQEKVIPYIGRLYMDSFYRYNKADVAYYEGEGVKFIVVTSEPRTKK